LVLEKLSAGTPLGAKHVTIAERILNGQQRVMLQTKGKCVYIFLVFIVPICRSIM
jgi:hypothetical protein